MHVGWGTAWATGAPRRPARSSRTHRAIRRRSARRLRATGTKVGGHVHILHVWRHHIHGRETRRRPPVGRMAGGRHKVTGRRSCSRGKARRHLLHSSPIRHTVGAGGVGAWRVGARGVGSIGSIGSIGSVGSIHVETRWKRTTAMGSLRRRRPLWVSLRRCLRRSLRVALGMAWVALWLRVTLGMALWVAKSTPRLRGRRTSLDAPSWARGMWVSMLHLRTGDLGLCL